MELMQLCSVLQASLSPDTQQRKAAEDALQQVGSFQCLWGMLIRLRD